MKLLEIIQELEDAPFVMYCLRHQETVMNALGYGKEDTDLTSKGRKDIDKYVAMIEAIGVHNIHTIFTGKLPRHQQTTSGLLEGIGLYKGKIVHDERLNAMIGGDLFEEPDPRVIEARYNLQRFKHGEDGLYHGEFEGQPLCFDPEREFVLPWEFYCTGTVDKVLRRFIFQHECPLSSFDEIDTKARSFQREIASRIHSDERFRAVSIGSCSAIGPNLELAKYGTIGENIVHYPFGDVSPKEIEAYQKGKGKFGERLYPQEHDEFSVFYLAKEDIDQKRERFRVHTIRHGIADAL
ncbi:MAG: histidine phosphatase family protein [Candidatus Woesearchaeota archaeon]